MIVELPVSIGELIDKISILLIKKNNIKDQNKIIYGYIITQIRLGSCFKPVIYHVAY